MAGLEDFPRNELEFHERFSDEEKCREYWTRLRWPDGFVCPRCGHKGGWRRRNREEWVCAAKGCGKETSPRVGTVLHGSRKPIRAWLMAMLHMSVNKQAISALRLQRLLGFGSYETAMRWLRELRRVMAPTEESERLSGEVEVDEAPFGGLEKGGKGPYVGKTWVVCAVEKRGAKSGRTRLRVLPENKRSVAELCGFVRDSVEEGSLVVTDAAQGYGPLADMGYRHDSRTMTNGKGGSKGSNMLRLEDGRVKAEIHLRRVARVFDLVERVVLSAFQGSFDARHLQRFLDEFCFRYNRRNTKTPLGIFQTLAARATQSQCVPYWKSSGRTAPDVPTRRPNDAWKGLGAALSLAAHLGYGGEGLG